MILNLNEFKCYDGFSRKFVNFETLNSFIILRILLKNNTKVFGQKLDPMSYRILLKAGCSQENVEFLQTLYNYLVNCRNFLYLSLFHYDAKD